MLQQKHPAPPCVLRVPLHCGTGVCAYTGLREWPAPGNRVTLAWVPLGPVADLLFDLQNVNLYLYFSVFRTSLCRHLQCPVTESK